MSYEHDPRVEPARVTTYRRLRTAWRRGGEHAVEEVVEEQEAQAVRSWRIEGLSDPDRLDA